ncbi:MAG: family multidrug efflux protein similarity to bicyclomycin resistance protein Bcr [Actinomycetia bacterium]|nr:family multidrug efflux protein similarity to bicyclomycin resistance protein Bcr [Actinomycetes bacterium]
MEGRGTPGRFELTALLALASALSALGIDLMLPAFDHIRADLGLAAGSTAVAGLVTTYFLGLATGQLIYGPLSDRYGRRPALYAGFAIYALGAGAAALAPSLGLLLLARFVWGLGAAGPRVVTQAVIRDTYEGDAMAKAMSLVMALFVLVPIIAPSLGAAVVSVTSWRWLFVGCMAATVAMALWTRRLPETLHPEHRLELRFGRLASAARMVVSDRQALAYTLAQTALYGAFMSWIGSAESIISETFDQEDRFPIIFGAMGAVIGIAMLTNARIVHRFTARRVVHAVLFVYLGAAAMFVVVGAATDGRPPLAAFLLILVTLVACHALLIPNCTSIAMAPMAAVAGTAASLMGAALIAGGAVLGSFVDGAFDGTMQPLAMGFLGYGVLGFAIVVWGERGRLFQRSDIPDEEAGLLVVEAL